MELDPRTMVQAAVERNTTRARRREKSRLRLNAAFKSCAGNPLATEKDRLPRPSAKPCTQGHGRSP
jgi:hypothetical protein